MRLRLFVSIAVVGVLILAVGDQTPAAVTTYSAGDIGGPGSPTPNCDAMAALFDADTITVVIDHENLPLGNFSSLELIPGVTATLTQTASDASPGISNSSVGDYAGWNTTPGGSQFLTVVPIFDIGTCSVSYDFASPISAFGTLLTGLGTANGDLYILFDDGASQSLPVAGLGIATQFYGLTTDGLITQVKLELSNVYGSRDIFSIDDTHVGVVPEPATLSLLALGGLALIRRKRK